MDEGKVKVVVNDQKYYKAQDMTPEICDLIDEDEDGQLVDVRDNTIYTIGKLKDGNCWMLDNFRLDLTNENVKTVLSSDNTNASDESIGYLLNGGGTSSDKYAIYSIKEYMTGRYTYADPMIVKTRIDSVNSSDSLEVARTWKRGIYYNACAISAGSYCFSDGSNGEGTSVGNITEDVCPAGWRLPTGNTSSELDSIRNYYDNVVLARTAFRAPLTGYYDYFYHEFQNDDLGNYWSSTRATNSAMWGLDVKASPSLFQSNRSVGRRNLIPARCIANSI